jgi:uncharacterized protein YegP (UPF0339 family)
MDRPPIKLRTPLLTLLPARSAAATAVPTRVVPGVPPQAPGPCRREWFARVSPEARGMHMYFSIGNDQGNRPRWWLRADNHAVIAVSGESFDSHGNAVRACESFKTNARNANFEVFLDHARRHRWHAKGANGQIIAASGEDFADASSASRAADNVCNTAGKANGP